MTRRAETALGGRDDRATSLEPRPVLCPGVAARVPCARESQARGRGRPRHRATPIAPRQEPERRSNHRPQEPGTRAAGLLRVRSEERRVGKEGRSRWSPYHLKKKKKRKNEK